ncbi:hypothetical protein DJ568_09450 [Mucilaginibacter hurinus]|uniref:Uncharacterized protein n=1 Tax=Mucilaginibacter hurinus TaxID=2201324 RepID=A0A367GNT6_9SPHI|nr:hypothetical protein DJ568_09450 [Mucilaginibacter hurinus]
MSEPELTRITALVYNSLWYRLRQLFILIKRQNYIKKTLPQNADAIYPKVGKILKYGIKAVGS